MFNNMLPKYYIPFTKTPKLDSRIYPLSFCDLTFGLDFLHELNAIHIWSLITHCRIPVNRNILCSIGVE